MNSRTRRLIILVLTLAIGGTLLAGGVLLGTVLRLRGVTSGTVTTSGTAAIAGPFILLATNGQGVSDRNYRGKCYVSREKSETGADDYLVFHSSYIYLMNPQGKFVDVIQGGAAGDEIAVWLRKEMMGGS